MPALVFSVAFYFFAMAVRKISVYFYLTVKFMVEGPWYYFPW